MRIAFISTLLSRKAGGLFVSVRQLAQALAHDPANEIRVFGSLDKHFDEDRSAWSPLKLTALPALWPKSIVYMPRLIRSLEEFAPEIVHVHGIWTYTSLATARFCKGARVPYLISPRGAMDAWALQQSPFKKSIALFAYERAHLSGAAVLHALAENELHSFRSFGIKAPVTVIPNGIQIPTLEQLPPPAWLKALLDKHLVMLFLGRIHPKKGLLELIEAVALLQNGRPEALRNWHIVIGGWDEVDHTAKLRAAIQRLGVSDIFTVVGPLHGAEKSATLANVHAFILPSFSEGLPMAVLEAWSWSLPTLITPECNLNLAFDRGAALRIANRPSDLAESLKNFFEMTDEQRSLLGRSAYSLVTERFSWEQIASEMKDVYRWILNRTLPAPRSISFLEQDRKHL